MPRKNVVANFSDYRIPVPILARKVGELVIQNGDNSNWAYPLAYLAAKTCREYPLTESSFKFQPLSANPSPTEIEDATDQQLYWHGIQV